MRHLEQLVNPRLDGLLQAQHFHRRVLRHLPFPGQGIGHLADFQAVEGLFQHQHLVAELQSFGHGFPGVIRKSGAQRDFQVRVGLPHLLDGFQAVPARRHAHVGEHQRIGATFSQCVFDQFEGFLPLVRRVELKRQAIRVRRAEQCGFCASEGLFIVGFGAEDLAEVIMNRRRVVDDQDAPVGPHARHFHPLSSVDRCGLSRIGTMLPAFSSSAACWLLTALLKK
ncbi:hypothetical protein D3C84_638800 [compost metagenome]